MKYHKRVFFFLLVPLAQLALAAFSFLAQGGFGGGHGYLYGVIGVCGLPGLWAIDMIPEQSIIYKNDLTLIIVTPAVINLILWWAIGGMVYNVRDKRKEIT